MITYAGAKLAWEGSKALRRWTLRVGLAVLLFGTGWVSSCTHYNDAAGENAVKAVVKQASKNATTVDKRIGEASKADARLEANEDELDNKQEQVNDAINPNSNTTECELLDDELRAFNELAKAASNPRD